MAYLGGTFDANTVEPSGDMSPLEPGEYLAKIIDSAMKPTKSGDGQYLQLTWQVVEGASEGLLAWQRLNLMHPNSQAQENAQGELSSICRATNKPIIQDSEELHHIPCVIKIRRQKSNPEYTEIASVKSASGEVPSGASAQSTPSADNVSKSGGSAPSWMRKAG